jgi:hypothetical protein
VGEGRNDEQKKTSRIYHFDFLAMLSKKRGDTGGAGMG